MIGLLTEQYAGAFPYWLAPVQTAVLPIADRHNAYAYDIASLLRGFAWHKVADGEQAEFKPLVATGPNSMRVEVDDRRQSLNKKIRDNQHHKIPFMLIVGDKDVEAGTVGVRSREEGDLGSMTVQGFLDLVAE